MTLSLEQLTPLLNSVFVAQTQAGPVELILVEARELPRKGLPEQFRTPLSLIFTGPPNLILSQDNYLVEHPVLGGNEWFVVPILSQGMMPFLPAIPVAEKGKQEYQVSFS